VPEKANAMMLSVTGVPDTLEDYVDFTMWTQAEGLKFGIEHFRGRKPHCSGALIWQFNDCWPCVSWSLIDHDGARKAGYYAVARAFAPVLASFKALGDGHVELWITNDLLAGISADAIVALTTLGGEILWREQIAFNMAANSSACVWRGEAKMAPDLLLLVRSPDGMFLPNRHLMAPISKIPLPSGARPAMAITRTKPGELRVELSASTFLPFVHLISDRADLMFSDNYFDMVAGERRAITVRGTGDLAPDAIEVLCWNKASSG
jgi:beta-mannosidase